MSLEGERVSQLVRLSFLIIIAYVISQNYDQLGNTVVVLGDNVDIVIALNFLVYFTLSLS